DCLKMNEGDSVYRLLGTVKGYIASGKSYDVYLTQGNSSHIIVTFENMDISEDIFVGDRIYVWGTIKVVDGVPRVIVSRKADWQLWGTSSAMDPLSFDSLEDIGDGHASAVVDLEGVVLSDSYVSENDKYIVVKDRMQNVMPLIVGSEFADMFNVMFEEYDDEEIVLRNVAVMKSGGRLYLQLIEQSSFEPQYGLIVSYTSKKIRTGVTLEEALEDLRVTYRSIDEDDVNLEKGQYTISCPDFDSTKSGKYTVTVMYVKSEHMVRYAYITITVSEPSNKENVEY
nr:bacterial Ig-like domain-containing protein [Clostridiales bacterium]